MPVDAIEYKGHLIEICHDEDARNPFMDDDGNPIVISEVNSRYIISYSRSEFFKGQRFNNWRQVFNHIADCYNINTDVTERFINEALNLNQCDIFRKELVNEGCFKEAIERVYEVTSEELYTRHFVTLLCKALGFPCGEHDSVGDSQGDYRKILVILDDSFFEVTGCKKEQSSRLIDEACNLYDSWVWGRVFGFKVPSLNESCWGFFGDDHSESGLLCHAQSIIDGYINFEIKQKVKRLKDLLKNKVPLHIRAKILK